MYIYIYKSSYIIYHKIYLITEHFVSGHILLYHEVSPQPGRHCTRRCPINHLAKSIECRPQNRTGISYNFEYFLGDRMMIAEDIVQNHATN